MNSSSNSWKRQYFLINLESFRIIIIRFQVNLEVNKKYVYFIGKRGIEDLSNIGFGMKRVKQEGILGIRNRIEIDLIIFDNRDVNNFQKERISV